MTKQVNSAIDAVKKTKVKNFYFVACGGSMALLQPAQYILDREIADPSHLYTANEFIHRSPKGLGEGSVVITCSHSGTTPETVKATAMAREKGALTISFSHVVDSPLWQAAEYQIWYDWGEEAKAEKSNSGMLYRLIFGILNAMYPNEKYARAIAAVDNLQGVYERNKTAFKQSSLDFARDYRREELIYTMGSGNCFGLAYSTAACLLQEMQWIHSNAIHTGEYFHGPFEVTDFDVPFMLIKGRGATRPLDERAEAFAKKYCERLVIIDAAEFDMEGIDEDLRGYFDNLVAGVIVRMYLEDLGEQRGHPLSVRRYMWKMEY